MVPVFSLCKHILYFLPSNFPGGRFRKTIRKIFILYNERTDS
jgi:hypothetical protein